MLKTSPKHHRRHPRLLKVKKVQRSFAVEYKSGRRKLNSKPSSIWGDTDLKSVAGDMQDEAMPFMSLPHQARNSEMLVPEEEPAGPLLTLPIDQETNASALQETIMADENDTMTNADTPAAAAPDVLKKVRKPRAKKAVPETASAAVSVQPAAASGAKAGKQTRGRKAKPDEGTTSARRAPVKRAPKAESITAAPSVAAVDEIADLLQLEEENQRLRKLLAEKLRAENADLRKRLNLG
nr:transcriptional regulator [Rhizobium leguminosarum]